MSIEVSVSVGEFLDKLTILQIKAERITEPDKLINVRRELDALNEAWERSAYAGTEGLAEAIEELRRVNERLWEIEDAIRDKEAGGVFDAEFIELARCVYLTNDERAGIKRRINQLAGSELSEEKSYRDYR
jgi:hypothetical protein